MGFFVICPACNEEHFVEEVEALNVEEGLIGEDLLTFRCIQTDTIQKSVVYGNNTHQFWYFYDCKHSIWIDTQTL